MKYRIAEFCAGVGGIGLGFKLVSKKFKIVYANDIDCFCEKTYNSNQSIKLDCRDIHDINMNEIPDFDIMCAGFPCQPFSFAGKRKGFKDKRSNVFYKLLDIIKNKKPKILFFENVKGLLNHDSGNSIKFIKRQIKKLGYDFNIKLINTCSFCKLPQNRERVYIICFNPKIREKFPFPNKTRNRNDISSYLEKNVDEKYFYKSGPVYDKIKDISIKDISTNTVYQYRRYYIRENKSSVCPTLTANMGTGGHNVPIISQNEKIRKLTPKECFNLQEFPDNWILPNISNSQLYKQAGNSVSIPIIKRLARRILKILETNEN